MRTLLAFLALLAALFLGLVFLRGRGACAAVELPRDQALETAAPRGELLPARDPERVAPERSAVAEESPEAAAAGDTRPPVAAFHGLLLDVATEEPIPSALAAIGSLRAEVDHEGRFEAAGGLPQDANALEFLDPFLGTHIRTISRDALELLRGPLGELHVARIAIGPTYRLQVAGVDAVELPESWRARLVEVTEQGDEHVGSYVRIHPAVPPGTVAAPFLRYDNPWQPNEPGSSFRVDVEGPEGLAGSSQVLRSAVGVHPGVVVIVPDRVLGGVAGMVVDTKGEGQRDARVSAVPVGTGTGVARFQTAITNGDGRFELASLPTGLYRLHVQARRGQEAVRHDVEVLRGTTDVGKLVVEAHEPVGSIGGKLTNRSGARLDDRLHVRLRAIGGRSFELLDVTRSMSSFRLSGRVLRLNGREVRLSNRELTYAGPGGEGVPGFQVFEFASVPAGEYELSVLAPDGVPWTPGVLRVTPPNEGVRFVREDGLANLEHVFDVHGAHAAVGDVFLQVHFGRGFSPELVPTRPPTFRAPAEASFTWSLRARGYRPAHGDASAFRDDGARRVARVTLEPGWGARLVLRDLGGGFLHDDEDGRLTVASRAPVVGARILADGVEIAVSDAAGIADLALDAEPEELTIVAPGWRQVESGRLRDGRIAGSVIDAVVWLVRR